MALWTFGWRLVLAIEGGDGDGAPPVLVLLLGLALPVHLQLFPRRAEEHLGFSNDVPGGLGMLKVASQSEPVSPEG